MHQTINVLYIQCFSREKFYAPTYDNPLVDAVEKQCPEIKSEKKSKYDPPTIRKRLSGEDILNILCNGACEILKEETSNGEWSHSFITIIRTILNFTIAWIQLNFLGFFFIGRCVTLESDGAVKQFQNHSLGMYCSEGVSNGKHIYKHIQNNHLYLHWAPDQTWSVCTMEFKNIFLSIKFL